MTSIHMNSNTPSPGNDTPHNITYSTNENETFFTNPFADKFQQNGSNQINSHSPTNKINNKNFMPSKNSGLKSNKEPINGLNKDNVPTLVKPSSSVSIALQKRPSVISFSRKKNNDNNNDNNNNNSSSSSSINLKTSSVTRSSKSPEFLTLALSPFATKYVHLYYDRWIVYKVDPHKQLKDLSILCCGKVNGDFGHSPSSLNRETKIWNGRNKAAIYTAVALNESYIVLVCSDGSLRVHDIMAGGKLVWLHLAEAKIDSVAVSSVGPVGIISSNFNDNQPVSPSSSPSQKFLNENKNNINNHMVTSADTSCTFTIACGLQGIAKTTQRSVLLLISVVCNGDNFYKDRMHLSSANGSTNSPVERALSFIKRGSISFSESRSGLVLRQRGSVASLNQRRNGSGSSRSSRLGSFFKGSNSDSDDESITSDNKIDDNNNNTSTHGSNVELATATIKKLTTPFKSHITRLRFSSSGNRLFAASHKYENKALILDINDFPNIKLLLKTVRAPDERGEGITDAVLFGENDEFMLLVSNTKKASPLILHTRFDTSEVDNIISVKKNNKDDLDSIDDTNFINDSTNKNNTVEDTSNNKSTSLDTVEISTEFIQPQKLLKLGFLPSNIQRCSVNAQGTIIAMVTSDGDIWACPINIISSEVRQKDRNKIKHEDLVFSLDTTSIFSSPSGVAPSKPVAMKHQVHAGDAECIGHVNVANIAKYAPNIMFARDGRTLNVLDPTGAIFIRKL